TLTDGVAADAATMPSIRTAGPSGSGNYPDLRTAEPFPCRPLPTGIHGCGSLPHSLINAVPRSCGRISSRHDNQKASGDGSVRSNYVVLLRRQSVILPPPQLF